MRLPNRGGNWNNGANAGLATLNLNNERSNSNSNIGCRPASVFASSSTLKGVDPCTNQKDAVTSAIAETKIRPLDASNGSTYAKIVTFENLYTSAFQCAKGKSESPAKIKFFSNLEENLIDLFEELSAGTYKPSKYHEFLIFEPKMRTITAPNFRDRVVHRAIYNVLYPLFDKSFIFDSYACREQKGSHAGADRVQSFMQNPRNTYALQADILKYFRSIDVTIVKQLLVAKIGCPQTLRLMSLILDSAPVDGIPLGALTSQLLANVYLHELDFFVKHTLGVKYYVRYMDDFVILHHSKEQLHQWRKEIEAFLWTNLKLQTNNKTQVFPLSCRAVDFLGYRIYRSHRLLRKNSVSRFKAKYKSFQRKYYEGSISVAEFRPFLTSWLAHAAHADSFTIQNKILSSPFTRGPNYVPVPL